MLHLLKCSSIFELKRYLRSHALLFVALAAPIAAHYMLPDKNANYAVLTVNDLTPALTASVLGLELGVLAATLLTPLAYIFLRAGPTRHRPWQITDVTPHSRVIITLGRWVSDTLGLWILLTALTFAGIVIGFFRLESNASIIQTAIALWLPAAPSLALIASIRLFLDARNLTRGWFGDIIFLFVWVTLIVLGTIGTTNPHSDAMTSNPLTDAFGFTAPILGAVDFVVTGVVIGGATNDGNTIMIDAWQGVTSSYYMLSRIFWLGIAGLLALVAGLIWAPMRSRQSKLNNNDRRAAKVLKASIRNVSFQSPSAVKIGPMKYAPLVVSEIQIMFKNKVWLLLCIVAAVSGAISPFRTVAGPALFLALIFPLTEASARWQGKSLGQLLDTLGPSRFHRSIAMIAASILVAVIMMLPALITMMKQDEFIFLSDAILITFVVPTIIVVLGALTRSSVAGRLLMLMVWYAYLSSASV